MFGFFQRWRRRRLLATPFPPAWREILRRRLPFYQQLNAAEQGALHDHLRVFLAEKRFEGCGGLVVTDEIRIVIAAQACLLLLGHPHASYSGLHSILVYPSAYLAPEHSIDPAGVVSEGEEARQGEAWLRGAIVLSWDDVLAGAHGSEDGHNVTLHEFAHQLDQQDGTFDGAPLLGQHARSSSWPHVLRREYEALQASAARGESGVIDPYGATDPAEFFAVVTEAFFETPRALRARHPALYHELKQFYKQDPLSRLERAGR